MPISPENREKVLAATREAAAAFVEDMQHIREVLARVDPVRGELRRLSAVLRRLVVDAGITAIAAPRIGRFNFEAPDNTAIYGAEKNNPYPFFGSAGVEAFGVHIRGVMVERGDKPRNISNFDPWKKTNLRLDRFQTQPVLCLDGQWSTRNNTISYVANIASGIHSGSPQLPEEKLLSRIRRSATYSAKEGSLQVSFDLDAALIDKPVFEYTTDSIDPVLLELLATAQFIATGADTSRLEAVIRAELKIPEYLPAAARQFLNLPKEPLGAIDRMKAAALRLGSFFSRGNKLPKLSRAGNLDQFRFTTVANKDAVLTVSTDKGDTLQVNLSDAQLLQIATHFPVYVNNLIRHRAFGQGAGPDITARATPEPISYEVNEDMYGNRVLLGIEHPRGMASVWALKIEAAKAIGRQLIERAQKVQRNTRGPPR